MGVTQLSKKINKTHVSHQVIEIRAKFEENYQLGANSMQVRLHRVRLLGLPVNWHERHHGCEFAVGTLLFYVT